MTHMPTESKNETRLSREDSNRFFDVVDVF